MADPQSTKPETALVPLKPREIAAEERAAALKRRVQMISENDARVAAGIARFRDLPSFWEPEEREKVLKVLQSGTMDEVRALGFKERREMRLALYGQMPKKDVPYAIVAAQERMSDRIRREGKSAGGATFNLNMINIPAPKPAGPEDRVVIVQKGDDK